MQNGKRFNFSKKEKVFVKTDNLPPPQSKDSEEGILSCLLQYPNLIPDAQESGVAAMLVNPCNVTLFTGMAEVVADGSPLDIKTLSQHLSDRRLLDEVGGNAAIAEMLNFIPTPEHYGHFKRVLRDKQLLRMAVEMANETIGAAHMGQDNVDGVADVIESGLSKVAEAIRNRKAKKSWGETVDELSQHWTQRYLGNEKSAIPSPWKSWNETIGGIRKGYNLHLGLRKTGKSSLIGHKALHLSVIPKKADRVKSIIFSFETPVETYVLRLASNLSGVRGECLMDPDIHRPTDTEMRKIARAMERIADSPIEVINATGMDVYQMERAAKQREAFYIGLDYLMLIPWLPDANQKEGTEGRIRSNSNAIIAMSRNLNACVDVINHSVKTGDRQGESRWSDQPQNDADLCVVVEEDSITVKENRNGKSGQEMPIVFHGETYSFNEEGLDDSVD